MQDGKREQFAKLLKSTTEKEHLDDDDNNITGYLAATNGARSMAAVTAIDQVMV